MANNFVPGAGFTYVYWSLNGELAVNVYGHAKTGTAVYSQAAVDALFVSMKGQFTNQIAARIAAVNSFIGMGIRDYSSPNLPTFRSTGAPAPGTGTGDPLPRGTSIGVTLRTALSGKSFRGRTYIPGWDELQNDASGNQLGAASTAAVAWVTALANAMSAAGTPMAVVSRPADEVIIEKITNPGTPTEVRETLSHTLARTGAVNNVGPIEARDSRWEYQRRRDNGRGTGAIALLTPVARGNVS